MTSKTTSPKLVKIKRVGQDLEVFFEDSTTADLVFEDYYSEMPADASALLGQAENGSFYEYLVESSGSATGHVSGLSQGTGAISAEMGGPRRPLQNVQQALQER